MNLPIWNLNEFYSSFKDEQINKDLHDLKKKINLFSNKYKGKLEKLKNQQLVNTLVEFEKIEEIILKLKSYAYLEYCTDQLDSKKAKFYQFIEESVLDCEKDIIFYNSHGWKYSYNLSGSPIKSYWNKKFKMGICADWFIGSKVESSWLSANDLLKKIK